MIGKEALISGQISYRHICRFRAEKFLCPHTEFRSILEKEVVSMNIVINEEIAPEIARAIIAKATLRGLSVNDYLRQLLGLGGDPAQESPIADTTAAPRNEGMLQALRESEERLKDMPVRGSTEETLRIIREGRAGAMWGYEPTDTE
jgi:hypothetical protein